MAQYPRLDPKTDVVFKLLFGGSEPLLIALLTAVLEPLEPIQRAIVQNPELPKDFFDDKGSYLDILVTLGDGTVVDVEMQCTRRPAFRERALYYWAGIFSGQLVSGDSYEAGQAREAPAPAGHGEVRPAAWVRQRAPGRRGSAGARGARRAAPLGQQLGRLARLRDTS